MIKGIQAFEACWMNLRRSYPTGPAQNLMIAQAMGQVTDHYGTAEEIERTLPTDLQVLFRTLIHAYFHGYAVNTKPTASVSTAVLIERTHAGKSTQKSQVGGKIARQDASGRRPLDDKTSQKRRPRTNDFWLMNPNETETLIIEFSSQNNEIQ